MRRLALTIPIILVIFCSAISAQQSNINLDWHPQKDTEHLTPFGANVVSPEVYDDGKVTFRLKAPDAHDVALAGGAILLALKAANPVPFVKGADGIWTLTVGPVRPDIYIYKIRIDGVAGPDPNNTLTGFAAMPGYSSVVVNSPDNPGYYDAWNVPHGQVNRHIYHSDVTGGERDIFVYTPPGYDRSKKYPLLVLLGGSGELASGWMYDGRLNFIADNLLYERRMVPMVIAMPNNQVVHRSDPQHGDKTFLLFESELRKSILPLVEAAYSVRTDRKGRAIAGLSMGGRHALFTGFKCLDLFSSFGILSAGDTEVETMIPEFLNDPHVNDKVDYLFLGQGKAEELPGTRTLVTHQVFEKHGIRHEYYAGGYGAHEWATWRHLAYYKLLPGLWKNELSAEARGTGPFKAVMDHDPLLTDQTVYHPLDLAKAGKLPIVAWGNGACGNIGSRYNEFLTEIASHGFLVTAIGPPGPPPVPNRNAPPVARSQQLTEAIEWALAENSRTGSPYYHRLDTTKIAVMGHSCGGLEAIEVASDPRITAVGIWNSGVLVTTAASPVMNVHVSKASLEQFHTPVAYFTGGKTDQAQPNAIDDFSRIVRNPVFMGSIDVGHNGTYMTPNGGVYGQVASQWLIWQLKGDKDAAKMFTGRDCGLCKDPKWTVQRKNMQ